MTRKGLFIANTGNHSRVVGRTLKISVERGSYGGKEILLAQIDGDIFEDDTVLYMESQTNREKYSNFY
ncbi:MAG: hypothetical protein ACLSCV_07385 [Acutalibacteraceae bacterium]